MTTSKLLIVSAIGALIGFKGYMVAYGHNQWFHSSDTGTVEEIHFSPTEDLERIDLQVLSRTKQTLDIAIYAFTDRAIAVELVRLAKAGVKIRLLRDATEFLDEQKRGESTTEMLVGVPNVQIRVKRSKVLMHEKFFVRDGALVRVGSANWSPAGEKRQDNDLRLTSNTDEIKAFEVDFESMFDRPTNVVVQ